VESILKRSYYPVLHYCTLQLFNNIYKSNLLIIIHIGLIGSRTKNTIAQGLKFPENFATFINFIVSKNCYIETKSTNTAFDVLFTDYGETKGLKLLFIDCSYIGNY
jgi:hypothetical protein